MMELRYGYRLPEEMRDELAKPYGKLYRGKGLEVLLRIGKDLSSDLVACVGDVVSIYAIQANLNPKVLVVDGKTVRNEVVGVENVLKVAEGYEVLRAENPQGCISCSLISALKKGVEIVKDGGKVIVIVEGEEDLAVMPLGLLLPNSSVVLYGQPGEGVVVLRIDEESKGIILKLLGRMHRVENCSNS